MVGDLYWLILGKEESGGTERGVVFIWELSLVVDGVLQLGFGIKPKGSRRLRGRKLCQQRHFSD